MLFAMKVVKSFIPSRELLSKKKLFDEFDEFMAVTVEEDIESEPEKEMPFEKITFDTNYKINTSLEEPPTDLELKRLPDHLEYAFLEEPSFLPVIISSQLSKRNKDKLISILKRYKQAFAWKTTDIPGLFLHAFLDCLCHLAILCHDQHAHTLHHLESLLTISLDRLDILKEDLVYQSFAEFEYEHVVMNPTSAGMRHLHLHLYMNPEIKQLAIKRVDEYGFVIRPDLVRLTSDSVGPFCSINIVPVIR
ncbi:hypothetical protein Tco_1254057 [Tanacetum coccineum]